MTQIDENKHRQTVPPEFAKDGAFQDRKPIGVSFEPEYGHQVKSVDNCRDAKLLAEF
jgi:hypothetical protein